MCFKFALLGLVCLNGLIAAATAVPSGRRMQAVPSRLHDKRQVEAVADLKEDHEPAETGFAEPATAAAAHGGSKYFQDIYVAMEKPGELQFGHVSETPNDWEQRFEKINLDNLKRQGKVRWGDKHGGYGEHYWDYNHAGHHHDGGDDGGEESQENAEYAHYDQGDETQNVPIVADASAARQQQQRGKRQPQIHKDVEFINDKARSLILDGNAQRHGGNYRREKDVRGKREQKQNQQQQQQQQNINAESLSFDPDAGLVFDEQSGRRYELRPIDF